MDSIQNWTAEIWNNKKNSLVDLFISFKHKVEIRYSLPFDPQSVIFVIDNINGFITHIIYNYEEKNSLEKAKIFITNDDIHGFYYVCSLSQFQCKQLLETFDIKTVRDRAINKFFKGITNVKY